MYMMDNSIRSKESRFMTLNLRLYLVIKSMDNIGQIGVYNLF